MNMTELTEEELLKHIEEFVSTYGGSEADSFESGLISQLVHTGLRLLKEGHDTGQLKLITRAIKEMRYAYRIFNKYRDRNIASIFGSARTPADHPDYVAAKEFSKGMSELGWMIITGAADGIMKAGLEGPLPESDSNFGLSIQLPNENTANEIIEGHPRLINFRYFFTRKLMFVSHSDAVIAFPGGFGTQDELFEVLTLIQTGKANIVPVILLEGKGGTYWHKWETFMKEVVLRSGWISPDDQNLYYIAPSVQAALDHITKFYAVYHSSRYVRGDLVIRLLKPLNDNQLRELNEEFALICKTGHITATDPFPEETDHLDLPRITFHHTRNHLSIVRLLIDRINEFA